MLESSAVDVVFPAPVLVSAVFFVLVENIKKREVVAIVVLELCLRSVRLRLLVAGSHEYSRYI